MRSSLKFLVPALVVLSAGVTQATTYNTSASTMVSSAPRSNVKPAPMAPGMNSGNMIGDLQTVRSCLCLQSQYQSQAAQVTAKQSTYTQMVNEKANLDAQIAGSHATAPDQVAMIRAQSERRIILGNQINNTVLPDLQQSTNQYNQSIAAFQQSCGNKSYDSDVLAQAKVGLTCPGG